MALFPITLDVTGKPCLVVGGGKVAARKVRDLLAAGASVRVVSPEAVESVEDLAGAGKIVWDREPFSPDKVDGAFLLMAATDDPAVNEAAYAAGHERGILVNVADVPPLCDFHVPAVVRDGDLQIAISTGGRSPALARRIREKLENDLSGYGELIRFMGAFRDEVASMSGFDQTDRQSIYECVLDSEVPGLVRAGKSGEAWDLARRIAAEGKSSKR